MHSHKHTRKHTPHTHVPLYDLTTFVCAQNIYSFIDESFSRSPCNAKIKHESSGADLAFKCILHIAQYESTHSKLIWIFSNIYFSGHVFSFPLSPRLTHIFPTPCSHNKTKIPFPEKTKCTLNYLQEWTVEGPSSPPLQHTSWQTSNQAWLRNAIQQLLVAPWSPKLQHA